MVSIMLSDTINDDAGEINPLTKDATAWRRNAAPKNRGARARGKDQTTLIPRIFGQSSKIQIKKASGTRRTWEEKLEWTDPEIKEVALTLKNTIENEFENTVQRISGSRYVFDKGKGGQKNRFAVLVIQKKGIVIRVRFDPVTSIDREHLLKDRVYDWFMKGNGEEREFQIDNAGQIESTLELISQSYDLAE